MGRLIDSTEVVKVDEQLRLVGTCCESCSARFFPRDDLCPFCLSEAVSNFPLSATGGLYSFTVIHVAPKVWEVPYAIGYVDLADGVRVFAKLANSDVKRWTPDQPVKLVVEQLASSDETSPLFHYYLDAA